MAKKKEISPEISDIDISYDIFKKINTAQKAYKCSFCEKTVYFNNNTINYNFRSLDKFYCAFCQRHRFYSKDFSQIMLLSFRGIIGYYYYCFYQRPINNKKIVMDYSEIRDMIYYHVKEGEKNPLFIYDPDTYIWFVDFTRIGKNKNQMKIEKVLNTVEYIYYMFDVQKNMPWVDNTVFLGRYINAVATFDTERKRPEDKILICPTLDKTKSEPYNFEYDYTRKFTSRYFRMLQS